MKENEILKIYGTDYKEMTKLLLTEAELESRDPGKKCQDWHQAEPGGSLGGFLGSDDPPGESWPVSSNTFRREVLHSFLCWKAPGLG